MPDELMNQKNTSGGVLFQKMTKCEKSIFFKKKIWSNFFKNFFGPSEAESFSDSKMVLLFDFGPLTSYLQRILFFPIENGTLILIFKFHPWRGLVKEDLNNLRGIQRGDTEEDSEDSYCSCSWFSDLSMTKKVIGILAIIVVITSFSIGLSFTIGWFHFNILNA